MDYAVRHSGVVMFIWAGKVFGFATTRLDSEKSS